MHFCAIKNLTRNKIYRKCAIYQDVVTRFEFENHILPFERNAMRSIYVVYINMFT